MIALEVADARLCASPRAKLFVGTSSHVTVTMSTSSFLAVRRRNCLVGFLNGTGKLEVGSRYGHTLRNSGYKASSMRLKIQCRGKGFGEKPTNANRKEPSNGATSSGNDSLRNSEVMPLNPKVDRVGGEEVAAKGAWEGLNWKDFATPAASPVLDMSEPKVRRLNGIY